MSFSKHCVPPRATYKGAASQHSKVRFLEANPPGLFQFEESLENTVWRVTFGSPLLAAAAETLVPTSGRKRRRSP